MEQIRFSFGLCAAATAVQMRLQDSVHLVYFHPFPLNSQLPQSQNSVPLLLKLGYINKSRLHINSCSCTHSNSKFALIWKYFFTFFFLYEMRFIFISFIFPTCGQISSLCITEQGAWMSLHLDVHYLHGGHLNIKYI